MKLIIYYLIIFDINKYNVIVNSLLNYL